jgi:hypothetical protein
MHIRCHVIVEILPYYHPYKILIIHDIATEDLPSISNENGPKTTMIVTVTVAITVTDCDRDHDRDRDTPSSEYEYE